MSTLEQGEALAAEGATAPRVTLQGMQDRVVRVAYFTAGDAVNLLAAGTPVPYDHPFQLLTICVIELDNGWTLLGKSAPASADNFDPAKGRQFAYDDALRQLWPLEGYLLRNTLAASEEK